MTYQVDIPESIATSLKLPEPEVAQRLRLELAVALYAQDILPFGKACEFAGIDRYQFGDVVASRGIPRHYTEEDLATDVKYARGK